jgi:hypothetical protein
MDHGIPRTRAYAYDSEDKEPDEEIETSISWRLKKLVFAMK